MSNRNLYDAYYFAHNCGRPYQRDEEWLRFFGQIAERIVQDINPQTVLDAGCAMGFLVEELRSRNVEAWGVDISEYALRNTFSEVQPFVWMGSVIDPFPKRYDLIVCIEVLEHLSGQQAEKAVTNLCKHTDDILFSSTPFDYKEATHFNVQPPDVWSEIFARNHFFRDVDFDASVITPWAVRYRKKREQIPELVRNYERKFWLLWKENQDIRAMAVEMENRLALQARNIDETKKQLDQIQKVLNEIYVSRAWKWIQRWRWLRMKIGI